MSIYLAVFLWFAGWVAVLIIAGLVHHFTRPAITAEPDRKPRRNPADECMVRTCTDDWEFDTNGWRMCRTHFDRSSAGRAS